MILTLDDYLRNIERYDLRNIAKHLTNGTYRKLSNCKQLDNFYMRFRKEFGNIRNYCSKFWLRILRREWKRAKEFKYLINAKIGGKHGEKYCSVELKNIRIKEQEQQKKTLNCTYIQDTETKEFLTDETGKRITLFDIAEKTDQRQIARVLNRVNALETFAKEDQNITKMYTITLHGKYHSNPANGNNTFNFTTPTQCKNLINLAFRSARRRMYKKLSIADRQINYARVFEPHKDATPHCHLIVIAPEYVHQLFVKEFNKTEYCADLKDTDGSIKTYDPKKGKLSTYMFKYILKSFKQNIAEEEDKDQESESFLTEQFRKKTEINKNKIWSNIWNIRLFEFGGTHTQGISKYDLIRSHAGYKENFYEFAKHEKFKCELLKTTVENRYKELVKKIQGISWNNKEYFKKSYNLVFIEDQEQEFKPNKNSGGVALISNDSSEQEPKQLLPKKLSEEHQKFISENHSLLQYYHSVIAGELQQMFKSTKNNEAQYFIQICEFTQFCCDIYEISGTGTLKEDAIKSFLYNIKDNPYYKKCINNFEAKDKFEIILECQINIKMLKDKKDKSNSKRY